MNSKIFLAITFLDVFSILFNPPFLSKIVTSLSSEEKPIEEFAPLETAESWDASGWVIDNQNSNDIAKVMLCLTPTEDVFQQALQEGCDMVVSHHPMFYVSLFSSALSEDFQPRLNVYSAHTNMDKANGGTTDTIIKTLGLEENKVDIEHDFLRMIEFPNDISVSDFSNILSKISYLSILEKTFIIL